MMGYSWNWEVWDAILAFEIGISKRIILINIILVVAHGSDPGRKRSFNDLILLLYLPYFL